MFLFKKKKKEKRKKRKEQRRKKKKRNLSIKQAILGVQAISQTRSLF
jgi:hypothetical protein